MELQRELDKPSRARLARGTFGARGPQGEGPQGAPAPAPETKPTLAPATQLAPATKPKPKSASAGACYPTLRLDAEPQNSSGLTPSKGVYWWNHHDIMEPICADVRLDTNRLQ